MPLIPTVNVQSGYQPQAIDTSIEVDILMFQYGSQKQWRDVLGVLKVQGEGIDRTYLNQWARELQLTELLDEALLRSGY